MRVALVVICLLASLLVAASPTTDQNVGRVYIPSISHGVISRGTRVMNCTPNETGSASWFITGSGLLYVNWVHINVITMEIYVHNSIVTVPKRGVARGSLGPRPGYYLEFLVWRIEGADGFILGSSCFEK